MRISEILPAKRRDIVRVGPTASVGTAIALMQREQIGAVLVMNPEAQLLGVLSERDIVHGLASSPSGLLERPVTEVARKDNPVAAPHHSVQSVMELMTSTRTRHIPIVQFGQVVGIVSIGDVIKCRLQEKTQENAVLQDIARSQYFAH